MIFSEFKDFIESNKTGFIKLPKDNNEYKILIQESLEYVAKNTIPTDLITTDPMVTTLRWLNSGQLIRKPRYISKDTDKIDIDEQLIYAVAYDFLYRRTKNINDKAIYKSERDNEITNYEWNNFKLLQELGVL